MKKISLVVLAAGMGSRYGGLKQLDFMTPEKETIIDFSIYDAINVGFTKIVFVIRKNFEKEFRQLFEKKLIGKIDVEYVFQELEYVPQKFINHNRKKPWGTAHAILMVKEVITENFAVINADDFYGKKSFKLMATALAKTSKNSTNFYLMGYLLKNTLSKFGGVSRGECMVNKQQILQTVRERTHIEKKGEELFYKKEDILISIDENAIVSMNFWGFTPQIFSYLEKSFYQFLEKNATHDTKEFFIPTVIDALIKSKKVSVKVLQNNQKWLGVTYKEDKEFVVNAFKELKEQQQYPKKLW